MLDNNIRIRSNAKTQYSYSFECQKQYSYSFEPEILTFENIRTVKKISNTPLVHIRQRTFEKLRPLNIRRLKLKDRHVCGCKYHIELEVLLKNVNKMLRDLDKPPLPSNLWDLTCATLCEKPDGEEFHALACLTGDCPHCSNGKRLHGVLKDEEVYGPLCWIKPVKWERYGPDPLLLALLALGVLAVQEALGVQGVLVEEILLLLLMTAVEPML